MEPGTITAALRAIEANDPRAMEILWQRFFERLCGYAESRIYRRHRRLIDPDQIATDAFMALADGVRHGRFTKVRNRDELWQMLTLIASRKTISAQRRLSRSKRGGGWVRGDSVFSDSISNGLHAFVSNDVSPTVAVELEELSQQLLADLPDNQIRKVAILRMAGHSISEIAEKTSFSERTIERKLKLIRKIWQKVAENHD